MKEMKSQRKDIPFAFNPKNALDPFAAKAKTPNTIVRMGKLARKFLHCASETSYTLNKINK